MGQTLSSSIPGSRDDQELGESGALYLEDKDITIRFGASSMQGWRNYQEDRYSITSSITPVTQQKLRFHPFNDEASLSFFHEFIQSAFFKSVFNAKVKSTEAHNMIDDTSDPAEDPSEDPSDEIITPKPEDLVDIFDTFMELVSIAPPDLLASFT